MAQSCVNESSKVANCAFELASNGWEGVSSCVIGGITSFTGLINNIYDISQVVSIKQYNYGYVLINDYLNDYYAKGTTAIPMNDTKLEFDIQKYADQLSLSSGGLFTFADFDMQFVKDGIRSSLTRNAVVGNNNVRNTEQIRTMLYK